MHQDVPDAVDEEVPVTVLLGAVLPPPFHGPKEAAVHVEQLVQAGEDPGHSAGIQLHLLLHAFSKDLRHDQQSLDVVHFCLHQF